MKLLHFTIVLAIMAHVPHIQTQGQGFPPEEAVQRMEMAQGLEVSLFAHEPEIRQAIFVKCDDRGRLWTIQYLQYPNPAGLKRVEVDRWSRTTYDRIPEPPPHGPRGADKITICEDTTGDGRADKFTDFVDGLNLVTGVAFGHGGVFVLNVPYLLFYPDRDQDDVPDSNPEVLLEGFGMEDAQSLANHLTWGPDGWLYGVNGSTTTCNIRGIEFQSGAWRFHPITKEFELFCEGGYNCYGLTFDDNGEMFYSTNGGPFIHAMQGAYYYKSFGKHGPLHNQYAYHHFPILDCDKVPGGPPTGGTIYRGDSFPEKYRGTFIAGNFLGQSASWWKLHQKGSTFRATYGDTLFQANDTWFGPTDMCVGPDGSMYVSDFYDKRTAHPDPDAEWDITNGRIYKIFAKGHSSPAVIDAREQTSEELVERLMHRNGWMADRALVELAHRRDKSIAEPLRKIANQEANGIHALRALWGLNAIGDLDEQFAQQLLNHPYPYVRYWVVRLLGDSRDVSPGMAVQLADLAKIESQAPVLGQLASTAKRLPPEQALPIVAQLLNSKLFASDERIPWLLWWAIESKAMTASDELLSMFSQADWSQVSYRENALRLIRRWCAEGNAQGYRACVSLMRGAPSKYLAEVHQHLLLGLSERAIGLHGIGQGGLFGEHASQDDAPPTSTRQYEALTPELASYIATQWKEQPADVLLLELAVRGEIDGAYSYLLDAVANAESVGDSLVALLELLADVGDERASPIALKWVELEREDVVSAALDVIESHGSEQEVLSLLRDYERHSPEMRSRLRDIFFGRSEVSKAFLEQVDQGYIDPTKVPTNQLGQLASHKDEQIDELVLKHWGRIGPGTDEEKLATMRRFNNDLNAGTGDFERGKVMYEKHCGTCHKLHGIGNNIGPDLTSANRQDRAALLANIVDPGAIIRREYTSYVVITDSGRMLTGLITEQDPSSITILDAQNRKTKIPRDEIDDLYPSDVSLMPERILDQLSPQELRDLFRYLEE